MVGTGSSSPLHGLIFRWYKKAQPEVATETKRQRAAQRFHKAKFQHPPQRIGLRQSTLAAKAMKVQWLESATTGLRIG